MADLSEMSQMFRTMLWSLVEGGMEPAEVARQVLSAALGERFWVLPNAEGFGEAIKDVAAGAVEGRNLSMLSPA
jgi:predicted ATPase